MVAELILSRLEWGVELGQEVKALENDGEVRALDGVSLTIGTGELIFSTRGGALFGYDILFLFVFISIAILLGITGTEAVASTNPSIDMDPYEPDNACAQANLPSAPAIAKPLSLSPFATRPEPWFSNLRIILLPLVSMDV